MFRLGSVILAVSISLTFGCSTEKLILTPTDTGFEITDTGLELIDADGDGFSALEDCDDNDANINPLAEELCDGVDNDCDQEIDEGVQTLFYVDADSDGYGAEGSVPVEACDAPEGMVELEGDCDDANDLYHPSASEDDCTDPADYNCDGSVGYADEDGDGYAACEECDDLNPATNPEADEYCDGVDNDCDTEIDEDDSLDASTWYADTDGDGFGDPDTSNVTCYVESGWVSDNTDCDDEETKTYPAADEYCDGVDNDCDTEIDEDDSLDATTWYADSDGDGYGDLNITNTTCYIANGWVADSSDCDDIVYTTNPGASEYCDGVDNNCDGTIDEDSAVDAVTWYADVDGDGYGDSSVTTTACYGSSAWISDSTDCDDTTADSNPSAYEVLDSDDNDCDGTIDESIVAIVYAESCLGKEGHDLYTAEEVTAFEHDRVEIYVNDMGYGLDRYDEISGSGCGGDLTVYEVVMFTDCGWAWSNDNQVLLDELLDARDLGVSTFAWGDDLGWSCSSVTGEEELTLVDGCYSNGSSGDTVTMSGSSHDAYLGPYGTPVDFVYDNDMDEVSAWAGTTVLAYNSAYGGANPAWSAYEDSLNGSRAISLETSIYMSNHDQVNTAAEAELEIIFKNSLSWLLSL